MIQLLKNATGATAGDYQDVPYGGLYTVSVADGSTLDGGVHITVADPSETAAHTPDSMKFATLDELAEAVIYLGDGEHVRAEPQGAGTDIDFLNLHPAG